MYKYYDKPLIYVSCLLIWIGTATVYSATNFDLDYLTKQLIAVLASLVVFAFIVMIPIEKIQYYARYGFLAALIIGIAVLLPTIGHTVNGSTRWISIGGFTIHTGELIKLFSIPYLASYISRNRETILSTKLRVFRPLLMLCVLCVLLLQQPDFGGGVVLLISIVGTLFLSGAPLLSFVAIFVGSIVSIIFLALSSPYRVARITSFLDPWSDPFNSGYQLTQSLIAFGRGELFGLGYGASIQKLGYLPEAHQDFIFAIFTEEFGALGAIGLMLLVLFVAYRIFHIGRLAVNAGSWFAGSLAFFTAISIACSAIFHIGVNVGVLPTKGLGLPFISYGRNSLVVTLILIAIIIRLDLERKAGTLPIRLRSRII